MQTSTSPQMKLSINQALVSRKSPSMAIQRISKGKNDSELEADGNTLLCIKITVVGFLVFNDNNYV